jgi:hypothetical protein
LGPLLPRETASDPNDSTGAIKELRRKLKQVQEAERQAVHVGEELRLLVIQKDAKLKSMVSDERDSVANRKRYRNIVLSTISTSWRWVGLQGSGAGCGERGVEDGAPLQFGEGRVDGAVTRLAVGGSEELTAVQAAPSGGDEAKRCSGMPPDTALVAMERSAVCHRPEPSMQAAELKAQFEEDKAAMQRLHAKELAKLRATHAKEVAAARNESKKARAHRPALGGYC